MRLLIMNPPRTPTGASRVLDGSSAFFDIVNPRYYYFGIFCFLFFFMSSLDADKYDNLRGAQINQPVIGIGQDST